jgi:hypothetical protein
MRSRDFIENSKLDLRQQKNIIYFKRPEYKKKLDIQNLTNVSEN